MELALKVSGRGEICYLIFDFYTFYKHLYLERISGAAGNLFQIYSWKAKLKGFIQGVWNSWNRREIQTTWPALPYDYTCFADGTSFD